MRRAFSTTYRKHFSATLVLAWPIILGQIGQMAMGVVDTAMVGRINEQSVAAAGVASAVFFLFSVFGFGMAAAISPLASMAAARKDFPETAGILRGAYRSTFIVSIIITLILLGIGWKFHWLKQDPIVALLAIDYLQIITLSLLPMLFFLSAKQFADGLSFTWPAMIITLTAIPMNAFLNWLLIYGNWGFPSLGLSGAGYATLATRIVMMVAMLLFIHKGKAIQRYVTQRPKMVGEYARKVMRMGIPSGFQYFFEVAAFGGAMIMAGWIGVHQQAAHQIAINVAALTYMAATGLSAAGGIRVGAAHGGFSKQEARQAGKATLLLGAIYMVISGGLLAIFSTPIARLFIEQEVVLHYASNLLIIAALFQLSDGIQCIGLGILRGVSDVKRPTLITLFAYWVIGLPLGYLLGFQAGFGIEGIWFGLLAGLSVSAILLYRRFDRITRI